MDGMSTTDTQYAVGHNDPGYLPDDPEQVAYCDTFDEAKRLLIGELDSASNDEDEDVAEQLEAAAQDVNLWNEPGSVEVSGVAYWIQPVEQEIDYPLEPDPDYLHDSRFD